MDMEREALRTLGARHPDVVAYTRAGRMLAARLAGNPHRGMIPGDECPTCYEAAVMTEDDPAPIWYARCFAHRSEWEARHRCYVSRLVDALESARSTPHMSEAPILRRRLACAVREWREVTGERFVSAGGA